VIALGALVLGFAILIRLNTARPAANADMFAYRRTGSDAGLSVLWQAPAFALHDQHGSAVSLGNLLGHVWIADFIFTTCQSQCPLLSAKMVLLQRQLTEPSLRFVSFSVDPAHDTPEALLRYAASWNEAESRWLLLHTEVASLTAISEGMRVTVEPSSDAKSPILHTSLFFLVDSAGGVRGIYDSNDADALARLRSDTTALLKSSSSPPVASLPAGGEALFRAVGCPGCHENPSLAPSLRGLYGSSVLLAGSRNVTADDPYLRDSIAAPGANVVAGYLNIMPAYAGELSPAQIDALVAYIRSLPAAPAAIPVAPSGVAPAPARLAVDPVCGMSVRAASTSPQLNRRDKFSAEPSKYLNHPPAPMR
jgi:protein SCO1/2